MKITKRKLQAMGACAEHVELFAETFPKGTYVTIESLAKAREVGLDIEWFADYVPEDRREGYNRIRHPALAEYNRIMQSARDEYDRIAQSARAEYDRTMQSAWAEYERTKQSAQDETHGNQTGTALAEYTRTMQSARAEYERIRKSAEDGYGRIQQPAWEKYENARDIALVSAFAD